MIDTWFISDTHFGHKKILQFESEARPFTCLDEMHEVMIERWNRVVKAKDIVYHLGDFAFGKHHIKIAARLNGSKRLVMGNHDKYQVGEYMPYFDRLYGALYWERCILTHMPIHPHGLLSRWLLNVHGHLHSRKVRCHGDIIRDEQGAILISGDPDLNYYNVSCEQNNLTPIHRDVITQRLMIL